MATKAREWPNNAAEARDRTAELANRITVLLNPIIDGDITEVERIRRAANALKCSQQISRLMEQMGAQTTVPQI